MATATIMQKPALDWLRIGAWSGSFAAHVSILLLIALPMTVPATREHATTIVARWIEPEIPPTFPNRRRRKRRITCRRRRHTR